MIFKVKITMHSFKLFKFLESVFDLPSLPPPFLEVIFVSPVLEVCCYGACLQSTLWYFNESGEACIGFHVMAMQAHARSLMVL